MSQVLISCDHLTSSALSTTNSLAHPNISQSRYFSVLHTYLFQVYQRRGPHFTVSLLMIIHLHPVSFCCSVYQNFNSLLVGHLFIKCLSLCKIIESLRAVFSLFSAIFQDLTLLGFW